MNKELIEKLTIDDCENCTIIEGYDDCIIGYTGDRKDKKLIYSYNKMYDKTKEKYSEDVERKATIEIKRILEDIEEIKTKPIIMYDFIL